MLEKNDQITLDMFVQKWWDIGLSTEPADKPTAEWAMRWLYKTAGYLQPRIIWKTSIKDIAEVPPRGNIVRLVNNTRDFLGWRDAATGIASDEQREFDSMAGVLRNGIATPLAIAAVRDTEHERLYASAIRSSNMNSGESNFISGQFNAGALGYLDYTAYKKDDLSTLAIYGLTNLAISASCAMAYEDICYISERPLIIELDEENRLHAESTPAISYADGFNVWSYRGNLVGEKIIKGDFTADEIITQNNVEIRRSMMDIYGMEQFLIDSDAEEIQTDGYGTLYRRTLSFDEDLVMVKVVNSTPEKDGSYKDYFLRVPPSMETAEQAVAWTFDMENQPYSPKQES